MVVMRSCCCCCTTKTGSTVIGVLYLLSTIGVVISLAYTLNNTEETRAMFNAVASITMNSTTTAGVNEAQGFVDKSVKAVKDAKIAGLVVTSIYCILCIAMIIGVCQENGCIMLPWIVVDFLRQLMYFIAFVFVAVFLGWLVPQTGNVILIIYCILGLLLVFFKFYLWLCVVGAYQATKEKDRISPVHMTDSYPMTYDQMAYPN